MKIKALACTLIAISVGFAAHAQDKTDTTKKDIPKKDTAKKDTSAVSLLAMKSNNVTLYQDTTKKDTAKKDTSSSFNRIAFYQDTTKKDTAKKDTVSMRVAVNKLHNFDAAVFDTDNCSFLRNEEEHTLGKKESEANA